MINLPSLKRLFGLGILLATGWLIAAYGEDTAQIPPSESASIREMSLEQCLNTAMQGNHRRRASKFAVIMAEAQHRQALSGYWPQFHGMVGYEHTSQSPDFVFPASSMSVPAQAIHVPAGTALVTVPAGVLGPTAVQLPVSTPAETIGVAAQKLPIAAQDIKLMDPDSFVESLDMTWLLYDGGMRKGYREQSAGLVDMMKAESRRTDLEVVDSVKRYYYGAILARELHQLGNDTLARMEATLNLTQSMYTNGAGKVKKTDFLDNKVVVETMRSMVAELEKNEAMAEAALANTMGLAWTESISPADKELPYAPFKGDLDKLVSTAYEFSPDWAKIEGGIRAAEGAVRTERSGYFPKLALKGELHSWENHYEAGLATPDNKEMWSFGGGLDIPLFSGFLTRHKVEEARARVEQLQEQKILIKEGIGVQIKDVFLGLRAVEKSYQATLDAMTAAQENRDLNTRAYENELAETDKVIKSELVEALMTAQHYKTQYDDLALQSQLCLLVGKEVLKSMAMTP